MTKHERITRLEKAIASPTTPEHMKADMESHLSELLAPEPEPAPAPAPRKPRPAPPARKPKPAPVAVEAPPPPVLHEFTEEEAEEIDEKNQERWKRKQEEIED